MGKSTINGVFSIAMLNYSRVYELNTHGLMIAREIYTESTDWPDTSTPYFCAMVKCTNQLT